MAKAKKGDFLSCEACGLVVVVDEACGCATAEVVCCDQPMAQGKAAANRVKKQTAKKPAAKAAAKAKPAKAAAKAKPVKKKPARAKK